MKSGDLQYTGDLEALTSVLGIGAHKWDNLCKEFTQKLWEMQEIYEQWEH